MLIIYFIIKVDNKINELKEMEARSLMDFLFLFDPNVAYVLLAVAFFLPYLRCWHPAQES